MIVKYNIKARQIERKFQREMNKKGYYLTAKGHVNHVIKYNKNSLTIGTEKGGQFSISRGQLRRSLSFFIFKRTVIRKDMELFTNYSSALFGILIRIFEKNSKLLVLRNGSFRLSLLGVRYFASGAERDPQVLKLLKEVKGHFVLFNFIQILESSSCCISKLSLYNLYAYIDSGAHTLFNQKHKKGNRQVNLFSDEVEEELILQGYADFINKHKDNERILGFFPLDVIGNPERTRENYHKLKTLTGNANIIPVWQVSDTLEQLEQLVSKEHELIAIGGLIPLMKKGLAAIRERVKEVFNKFPTCNFHFLGGANELLKEFNWFSSDSTAFLNGRKSPLQRKVYLPSGERVLAPSNMQVKDVMKQNLKFLVGLEDESDDRFTIFDYFPSL
ncbi:hypothetical protein [Metabacillus fastidiosus]|uniref:tRNA-guanine(15) transglycosylase-like domain-containing protein n=1 Tax=Metabacillus fastidiosus TaxID=1458 RepID=A0ABU6NT51_9BACI|nr:hypothetical protein [Metabacillus fastidiosus]